MIIRLRINHSQLSFTIITKGGNQITIKKNIMKKILSILSITAILAACNSNPKTGTDTGASVTTTDTATANHNAFTDKASEVQLNGVNDTIVSNDGSTFVKVKPKDAETAPARPAAVTKEKHVVHHTSTHTSSTASGAGNAGAGGTTTTDSGNKTVSTGTSGTGTSGTETSTTTTTTTQKKGWSKAATGAVIGAGTGAAAGAIISKKKGKGAIIGGIIGGAGGYILGRSKDKKDGRY